ncbi:hypothetical protein TNCV_4029921 [Trichonephila clavipes]|nr:hypothetical protein TNCV_4029921 [Trichonephila clavipes]
MEDINSAFFQKGVSARFLRLASHASRAVHLVAPIPLAAGHRGLLASWHGTGSHRLRVHSHHCHIQFGEVRRNLPPLAPADEIQVVLRRPQHRCHLALFRPMRPSLRILHAGEPADLTLDRRAPAAVQVVWLPFQQARKAVGVADGAVHLGVLRHPRVRDHCPIRAYRPGPAPLAEPAQVNVRKRAVQGREGTVQDTIKEGRHQNAR